MSFSCRFFPPRFRVICRTTDRLRFVHDMCWVVNRVVGSLVGFGGCPGAGVCGEDTSRVQGVPKKLPTRKHQKSCAGFVQAVSKHHPSCIQARSICIQAMFRAHARTVHLQGNRCVAAPPKYPLYNIKKGELVEKPVFVHVLWLLKFYHGVSVSQTGVRICPWPLSAPPAASL